MNERIKEKKIPSTRKKIKVIGLETYINQRTGALEDMQVISIEDRDANFHKIWLQHIIMSLDVIGTQKMRFAFWLLEQMTTDNLIPMTFKQMAEKSGYSIDTVKRVIPALIESEFLVRINQGVYQVNPSLIFKGGSHHRMNVLMQYQAYIPESNATSGAEGCGERPEPPTKR
jgi:hypothetical protein